MLKMVNGTGIIGVDMICPLGVSPPQPPNYDRVELEGAGMLVLPNSLDAPLERLELGGKTEQVQTTGVQLFDISKCPLEHDDVSFKIPKNSGNVVLIDGYVFEENTQYTISAQKINSENANTASFKFDYTDGTRDEIIIKDLTKKGLTSDSAKNVKQFVLINPYGGVHEVFGLQIEKGSAATTYEPYTGGKPSPSPEYPQEIVNAGKWNDEKQKYEVDVKVVGKNIFDVNYFTESENYQNKEGDATYWKYATFKAKPNTTYTVSKQKNTNVNGAINNGIYYGGALAFNSDVNSVKITTKDDGVLYVMFFYRSEDVNILKEMDIQIELGETLTEYEPYKEQTLTLTSDRPITKWDKLVEQGGQIGWLYQSEIDADVRPSRIDLFPYGFNLYKNHENGTHTYNVTNIKKAIGFQTSYCKQFKNKDAAYQSAEMWHYSDQPSMKTQYFNTDIPTREEFIEWMESNPLTMVYKTEKTEFVPLPQEEQDAIRALKTYYPTTVITVDGGELYPDIKVTYRKEI